MQNIDKYAIVAAAVILLGGVLFATLGEDLGQKYADEIQTAAEKVEDLKDDQSLAMAQAPEVHQMVRAPFQIEEDVNFPAWTFYRKPASLVLFEPEIVLPPELTVSRLSKVEVVRNASEKKTHHKVSGVRADMVRAELISETLQISEGTSGEWTDLVPVPEGVAGTDFVVSISDLEASQSYRYRVVTTARSTSTTGFASGEGSAISSESDGVDFPPDTAWRASGAQVRSLDAAGGIVPGRVTIQYITWNWQEQRTVVNGDIVREPERGTEGRELFGTGYTLERIEEVVVDGVKKRRAVLKKIGDFKRLFLINNLDPSSLEPKGWENEEPEATEEPTSEGDGESVEATEIPAIPDTNTGGGGGLFGGDDD